MINPNIKVKCKHCNQITTINVKSLTDIQDENERLRNELASYKFKESGTSENPVDYFKNLFYMK